MKRVFLFVLVVGLLVGAAVIVGAMRQQSLNSEKVRANQETTPEPTMDHSGMMNHETMEDHSMTVTKDSRYVEYSKDVFDVITAPRRVLFFYSTNCDSCQPADVEFMEKSEQIPTDVAVIRINIDDENTDPSEEGFARINGVSQSHTFVQIDTQGRLVTRWSGGQLTELLTSLKTVNPAATSSAGLD